jgi:hypothetical protein
MAAKVKPLSSAPDHAVGAVPPIARDYHDADGTLHFFKRGLQYTTPDNTLELHLDEGWHLHQPASLRQGGFHESGMWPFQR